jgi:hypothetical protein
MLSKTEQNYVRNAITPSKHYSIVLKSRVEDKLQTLKEELTILAEDPRFKTQVAALVTEIRDKVTENSDQTKTVSVNALYAEGSQRVTLCRGQDLNLRQPGLQPGVGVLASLLSP